MRSDQLGTAVAISSPELEAIGARVAGLIEEAVEATIRDIRTCYADPLLALLGDVPECLAPPDEARDIPLPAGGSVADREQYRCAIEGTKRSLVERLRELLDEPTLRETEGRTTEISDALAAELDRIASDLPPMAEAEQEDRHFFAEPIEPRRITAAKAIKRVIRPMRQRWTRDVPVAGVARWAAAQLLKDVSPAIADLERLRIRVLSAAAHDFHQALRLTDEWSAAREPGVGASPDSPGAPHANGDTPYHDRDDVVTASRQRRAEFQGDVAAAEASLRAAAARVGERFAEALTVIGTVERSTGSVDEARVGRQRARILKRRESRNARWRSYEQALLEGLLADTELVELRAAIFDAIGNAIGEIEETTTHRVREPLARLEGELEEAQRQADAATSGTGGGAASLAPIAERAAKAFATALGAVQDERPLPMLLRQPLESATATLETLARRLEPERKLASVPADDVSHEPGNITPRDVPLRRLVEVYVAERLSRELLGVLDAARPDRLALETELRQLQDAVAFNFKSAADAIESGSADAQRAAHDLTTGSVARSLRRIRELMQDSVALDESIAQGARGATTRLLDELAGLVGGRNAGAITAAIRRHESTVRGIERAGAEDIDATPVDPDGRAADIQRRAREVVRSIGRRLRTVGPLGDDGAGRAPDAPVPDAEPPAVEAPLAYRQLFADEPLQWPELVVGRERELAEIVRIHEQWVAGRPASIAIVGERGSGKSTLVLAARAQPLVGERVRTLELIPEMRDPEAFRKALAATFDLPTPASLQDLADPLRTGGRQVAIVEECERIFLRQVGGFALLEDFLALVHATARRVLWILTIEEHAWRYLERTLDLSRSFACRLSTRTLTADQISEAIRRRHAMSGMSLRFAPTKEDLRSRGYRRAPTDVAREAEVEQRYFERLGEVADGNIGLALLHWLRSIRAVDGEQLTIGGPPRGDAASLKSLDVPALLAIAAVIQHGGLSGAEHAAIFEGRLQESERLLWSLADAGILCRRETGRYDMERPIHRPAVRLLQERNILS